MSERKINLKKLAIKYGIIKGYSIHSNPKLAEESFNNFCKDFAKQLLELAAENANKNDMVWDPQNSKWTDESNEINKQSILDTIKQVE